MSLTTKKKTTKKKTNALKLVEKKMANGTYTMTYQATPTQIMNAFANRYGLVLEVGDVMVIESKPYITKSGLLRLSHIQKVKAVMPKIIEVNYEKGYAHYECVVTTEDNRTYRDQGYCDRSEPGKRNMHIIIGTALTRARNRAIAAATATPHCTYDELDDYSKKKAIDITKIVEGDE
jgi:hypothetical protein